MDGDNRGLKELIEEIEGLEAQKAEIAAAIARVYQRAKARGFETAVMRQIVKERRIPRTQRQEYAALLDLYRATLGMLDGTPLGEAARKRLLPRPPDGEDAAPAAPEPGVAAPSPEQVEQARAEGAAAQKAGKRVVDNPYGAGDPRRAAWDEGWCAAAGSDGMDIPPAWRRPPKPGKGEGKGPDA